MDKVYQVVVDETIVATFSNKADADATLNIIEEQDFGIVREVKVDQYKHKIDQGLTPYKVVWFVDRVPQNAPIVTRPVFSLDEDFEIKRTLGNQRVFHAVVWARDEEHAKQKMYECYDEG